MKRSASGSTGGSAGVVVAGTEPPNDGCAACAPPTRAMNWVMMSRSSLVIGHPPGFRGCDVARAPLSFKHVRFRDEAVRSPDSGPLPRPAPLRAPALPPPD